MIAVVHGSYFANNFGDTLLVKMACDEVASLIGAENVYLAVKGNEVEQKSIGYSVLPTKLAKKVTHVVYAGGGYLGEPNGNLLRRIRWSFRNYHRHLAWLNKYPNARIGFFGVGYGPLTIDLFRHAVDKVIDKADVVLFRDDESIAYLKNYNNKIDKVEKCVDFALSLKPELSLARTPDLIALHLPGLVAREIDIIISFLAKVGLDDKKLEIILDNPVPQFSQTAESMRGALLRMGAQSVLIRQYTDMHTLMDCLKTYNYVITNKLHVGIVTIALGGKVISVPTHQKTIRLYKQLGLERFCVDRNELCVAKLVATYDQLDGFEPNLDVVKSGVAALKKGLRDFIIKE